jgi:hemoglobin
MKHLKTLVLLCTVLLFINCGNKDSKKEELAIADNYAKTVKEQPKDEEISLFERLGGTAGISSIVDNVVDNHLKNPVVNQKFSHLKPGTESYEIFKTHVKEFLAAGTGGTIQYTGKDMVSAHTGFSITGKEFLSTTDDVLMALDSHNIDEETKKDMLYILYSMKDAVMEK